MTWARSSALGLGFVLAAAVGCFDGKYLLWEACSKDADCGRGQQCVDNLCLECSGDVCSPYVCPVTEVDGVCPCPGRAKFDCAELAATRTNKVDILLVVDNSGDVGQSRLVTQVQPLIETLNENQVDYRVAMTTTDIGNPACGGETTPADGQFILPDCVETAPTVVDGSEDELARPWLEVSGGVSNLANGVAIEDGLECLLSPDTAGCGFEAPLESLYRALERAGDESDPNYGFVREDAHLLVVLLTDQADCSYQSEYSDIFADNTVFYGDNPEPSPTICWNAGVECIGDEPPFYDCIAVDKDSAGSPTLTTSEAVLYSVDDRYVARVAALDEAKHKRNPLLEVVVTVIAGVPTGYEGDDLLYTAGLDPDFELEHGIAPGCTATVTLPDQSEVDVEAVPPVRLLEFASSVHSAEGSVNVFSICEDSFDGAFDQIDTVLDETVPALCMPTCVAEPANCEVASFEGGQPVSIPACEDGRSLGPAQDLCFYTLTGDGVAPRCTEQGGNVQFGFDHLLDVEVPETVYASCEPATSATSCPSTG